MSLKIFDYSLFTNLSFRHLFSGMLHGYELIPSRIISRTILRRIPCMCNDYLLNTSHLLDCTYLLSANPFAKTSHLKKGWKATAPGSHLFNSKFWYLPPLLGLGRNWEGWEREKREILGRRLPENGGQKTVRQLQVILKKVLNSIFPVPIICGTCRKSHKIAIELLPQPNCGCATHNWFR